MESTSASSVIVFAECQQDSERSDQGYRDGNDRNERRAPAAKKQKHHKHDQGECLDKRAQHFRDSRENERRAVEYDLVAYPGREALAQALKRRIDRLGRRNRVGSQSQIDRQ